MNENYGRDVTNAIKNKTTYIITFIKITKSRIAINSVFDQAYHKFRCADHVFTANIYILGFFSHSFKGTFIFPSDIIEMR